jgi:hypothetical protein
MAEALIPNARARRWLIVALVAVAVLGLALAGAGAYRILTRHGRRPPPPPRQTDVSLIAGWMTVPYVGRTFGVPPPELYKALRISPEGKDQSSLNDLATETGRTPDELVESVKAAVQELQAEHQNAPDGPPPERGPPDESKKEGDG